MIEWGWAGVWSKDVAGDGEVEPKENKIFNAFLLKKQKIALWRLRRAFLVQSLPCSRLKIIHTLNSQHIFPKRARNPFGNACEGPVKVSASKHSKAGFFKMNSSAKPHTSQNYQRGQGIQCW